MHKLTCALSENSFALGIDLSLRKEVTQLPWGISDSRKDYLPILAATKSWVLLAGVSQSLLDPIYGTTSDDSVEENKEQPCIKRVQSVSDIEGRIQGLASN
jgi:hypothetical protein